MLVNGGPLLVMLGGGPGASKAALNSMGQSLAVALAPYGIAVASVAPGAPLWFTATSIIDNPRMSESRMNSGRFSVEICPVFVRKRMPAVSGPASRSRVRSGRSSGQLSSLRQRSPAKAHEALRLKQRIPDETSGEKAEQVGEAGLGDAFTIGSGEREAAPDVEQRGSYIERTLLRMKISTASFETSSFAS